MDLCVVPTKQAGFSHFEHHNARFRWNHAQSELDIFLPLFLEL